MLAALPQVRAQQVLVQANVATDTIPSVFGPNRRYFAHLYLGYGLVAGPSGGPGTPLRYGLASAELQGGVRLKRRFTQALALNLDLRYAYLSYALAQTQAKTLPSPRLHLRESLALHQLQPELSLRLNAGRRGNTVGHYLDLLAWGSWAMASTHTTEDEPGPGVSSLETTERGLAYLRRWGGGVGARLGADRYALLARYRVSSAFSSDYASYPELPRWVIGLELGWF
ncbi:hypothetical protein [Hymenobacter saemangeumensis]